MIVEKIFNRLTFLPFRKKESFLNSQDGCFFLGIKTRMDKFVFFDIVC